MKKIYKLALMAAFFVVMLGMIACGRKDDKKPAPELSTIYEAVKNAYGKNYIPDMPLDSELIANMKTISADLYSEFIVEIPSISEYADEFMAFKAAPGKADELEKALNDYKDYLINDSFQYPANRVRVRASQVIRHGDYMFFVLLGSVDDETQELDDAAILKAAKDGVKIGVDVINGFFK